MTCLSFLRFYVLHSFRLFQRNRFNALIPNTSKPSTSKPSTSIPSTPIAHTILKASLIASIISLSGCLSWITPTVNTDITTLKSGDYQLDKSHARLLFKISHLGLSDFVGRFNQFDAGLTFDPATPENSTLHALVDMNSLDINDRDFEDQLKGSDWLSTNQFPQAEFTSVSVSVTEENTFEFIGNLNWRNVSKPVTFEVTFHGGADNWLSGNYTLGFTAIGRFKRSDFGMDSYLSLVGDEIRMEVYAEFLKQ